jgi:hypothetical protein
LVHAILPSFPDGIVNVPCSPKQPFFGAKIEIFDKSQLSIDVKRALDTQSALKIGTQFIVSFIEIGEQFLYELCILGVSTVEVKGERP